MPLPTGRNRTYGTKNQVSHDDLNDIQDQIIALNTKLYTPETLTLPASFGQPEGIAPIAPWVFQGFGVVQYTGTNTGGNIDAFNIPLPVPAGRKVTALRLRCQNSTANANRIKASLYEYSDAGLVQIGTTVQLPAAVNTMQTLAMTPGAGLPAGTGYTLLADRAYFLMVQGQDTGTDVRTLVKLAIDHVRV